MFSVALSGGDSEERKKKREFVVSIQTFLGV